MNYSEGEVLLVDKPLEWTSFDVVKKLKWLIQKKEDKKKIKLGHAGTLDPLASGLLILCSGKKTKSIQEIQAQRKEYTGEIYLGAVTPTYDLESEPEQQQDISAITEEDIIRAKEKLTGKIAQMPPAHSAKKIDGKRAYELARKGEEVNLKPKEIEVYEFELTAIRLPIVEFRIACSKGTYIRSMAHDLGQLLGVGAYLNKLRRTKIGDYRVEEAKGIEDWVKSLQA